MTFKTLVNAKTRCFKCNGYGHYDYQCALESQYVRIVSSDEVDDSKVVEDVHISSKTASIIEDIAVGSDTPIIDEIHMSSDSASDNVDEIVSLIYQLCLVSHSSLLVLNLVLWLFLSIHLLESHLNFLLRANR